VSHVCAAQSLAPRAPSDGKKTPSVNVPAADCRLDASDLAPINNATARGETFGPERAERENSERENRSNNGSVRVFARRGIGLDFRL